MSDTLLVPIDTDDSGELAKLLRGTAAVVQGLVGEKLADLADDIDNARIAAGLDN